MTNLSMNVVVSAQKHADSSALRCGEKSLTFVELDAAAARFATFLERAGIGPGRPGAQAGPEELKAFVKPRVAAATYARPVWIVDALPKDPTGKILRRDIIIPTFESST